MNMISLVLQFSHFDSKHTGFSSNLCGCRGHREGGAGGGGGHFSPSTFFFGMVIYFLFSAFGVGGVGGAFPVLCKKHFHLDKDPTSGKLIVLVWWLQFYSEGTSKLAADKPRRRGWCKNSLHVFNHITTFLECSVACILLNFIINVQRCIIDA